ncbi:MAG: hypothetical protein KatS3mg115_0260 [Candidatus Poribacteria bacterium]|nr:MAG: hypothetical protein KatS3mg115_0260 [Candidatus Poribacteria bacterium]
MFPRRTAFGLYPLLALWAFVVFAARAGIDIAVYTETVQWIAQPLAQQEADKLIAALEGKPGIDSIVNIGMQDLAAWTEQHTVKNGHHIIVLYGDFPPTIYPQGNAEPDGSLAEEFLDAGNTFANSNDYFFWGLNGRNQEGGLQNMMDIPGITMWDDNTPMTATAEGKKYMPNTLPDKYTVDRPFHVDQIAGTDWELEIAFGSNTGDQSGTRCDPCIIHNTQTDGRLIQVFQTNGLEQKEGEGLAEIILNYYLEAVDALPVEPKGKLSTTWADLKIGR